MNDGESKVVYKDISLIPKGLSKQEYKKAVVECRQQKWENNGGVSLRDKETLVEGKKQKIAILLSYSGRDYYGLQHNPGDEDHVTIEWKLFEALVAAKVVYSNILQERKKCSYTSCSRTDKGVSAIGNVASLKCVVPDNFMELVNAHLPADIRITGVNRVTKGFDAKNRCTHRTYSYYAPTVCFATKDNWSEDKAQTYRIDKEKLNTVNSLLGMYNGTKSYHNFTSGKLKGDMSARRHILSFQVHGEPFIYKNWEYVELRVKGQSFMIHQIRKMIGLVIAYASGHCGDDHVTRAFEENMEDIPKAPGNGLVLRQVHYDQYNKDYGEKGKGSLEWEDSQDKMNHFAKENILPQIFELDVEEKNMLNWLMGMDKHDFTGKRAKEQWEAQELVRKRKKEQFQNGQAKIPKQNDESLEKPLETNED